MTTLATRRTEFRFLLATLIASGILAFLVFRPLLYYIAFGVLLVFGFWPVHRRLSRRVKNRPLAAFLSFLLVALVILGPLIALGFAVFNDAVGFAREYEPDKLNETMQTFLDRFGVEREEVQQGNDTLDRPSQIANFLGGKVRDAAEALGRGLLAVLPGLALGLFVTGFIVYYGFLDGPHFYEQLRLALPFPEEIEDALFHQVRAVTKAVFAGTLFTSFLTAAIGTVTFLVFGVPNAIFFGMIMLIFGILPVLGPPFVFVPVTLWLYIEGRTTAALGVFLINGFLGSIYVERILAPKFVGRLGRIHPVWVLIGVLGGLEVLGIMGFILGPLALAIFIALLRAYTEFHPRWLERRAHGLEPFVPGGELEPQPFEVGPGDVRPSEPKEKGPAS